MTSNAQADRIRTAPHGLTLLTAALAMVGGAGAARADCDHFKWSLAREQAAFAAAAPLAAGAATSANSAATLPLVPLEDAHLPVAPERAPAAGSFAALVKLGPVAKGVYEITLSEEAWVDVVQNGATVKSIDFSGQKDCPGLRKSVKFALEAGPAQLEISNSAKSTLTLGVFEAK